MDDLRQLIATVRQLLLDGEVEDALEVLHADDAAPPVGVTEPVTRYEREILVAKIEQLTRERDDLIEHCNLLDQQMKAGSTRTADHFETADVMHKWASK